MRKRKNKRKNIHHCQFHTFRLFEKIKILMRKEGINVVFSKGQTLQDQQCRLKPKRGRLVKKDVVYMVDCKVCGLSYIGETAQHFNDRAGQHQNCIKNNDRKNGFAMHFKKINW
mmetsp:Transcript_17784/g.23461  ORF Transcript_17784/g.23461 Transcript_17784/m.23461 type:complete len:114 (+) Transcript_17784:95-436(+)